MPPIPKLSPGQILVGSESSKIIATDLKEGVGINIKNVPGSITISSTGVLNITSKWTSIKDAAVSLVVNKGYILESKNNVILTLPSDAQIGDEIKILSTKSTWEISPKENQEVIVQNSIVKTPKKIWTVYQITSANLICVSAPSSYMISWFSGLIKNNA